MRGYRGAAREMPCEACSVQFSVFRRKRACMECARLYCAACLRRGGGMCAPCRALSTRPLQRAAIVHLKPRDMQCFLHRQNVSTRGCVEKEDLISLCVCHVNSAAYRRRGPAPSSSTPFTLKGISSNISDFIITTFNTTPASPPTAHVQTPRAAPATSPTVPPSQPPRERFTTNPGGERDFRVPPPPEPESRDGSSEGEALLDTTDCFEVEDLDDAGWEFVTRPADPLPNDSTVLMASPEQSASPPLPTVTQQPPRMTGARGSNLEPPLLASAPGGTPQRAASLLDLRQPPNTPHPSPAADRVSLSDEPILDNAHDNDAEACVTLDSLSAEQLEGLSVRALKGLLARNRVEFRSCVERGELVERAQALLVDHHTRRAQLDALPLDECCKICMAAPLECVLLECGHIAACTDCAKQLSECPICRRYVVRAVRCFRA